MPSSSWVRPRSITREPNPFRDGGVTGGPSFSCHDRISRSALRCRLDRPVDPDRTLVIGKRTVFHGVGCEFIERDAKCQGRICREADVLAGDHQALRPTVRNAERLHGLVDHIEQPGAVPIFAASAGRATGKAQTAGTRRLRGSPWDRNSLRKACQTIDCTVASVFFTRWFNSSMSIRDCACSSLCLVRSTKEVKYWTMAPLSVPDRADEKGRPKFAAILAPVEDFRARLRIAFELRVDTCQRLRRRRRPPSGN